MQAFLLLFVLPLLYQPDVVKLLRYREVQMKLTRAE